MPITPCPPTLRQNPSTLPLDDAQLAECGLYRGSIGGWTALFPPFPTLRISRFRVAGCVQLQQLKVRLPHRWPCPPPPRSPAAAESDDDMLPALHRSAATPSPRRRRRRRRRSPAATQLYPPQPSAASSSPPSARSQAGSTSRTRRRTTRSRTGGRAGSRNGTLENSLHPPPYGMEAPDVYYPPAFPPAFPVQNDGHRRPVRLRTDHGGEGGVRQIIRGGGEGRERLNTGRGS